MFAHRTGRRFLATVAAGLLVATVTYIGPAAAAPVRYEAENATIGQGVVESNHANFSGTGFVNGDNVVGSYVEWTVTSTTAGTATFSIRFANGLSADRPADVAVNGSVVAPGLVFQSTGAWATWATKNVTATVRAGSNTIRVTSTTSGGGPNLDYVDVESPQAFTDYQAESAVISQGVVESNWAGYTGTGFVNGDNVIGSYVQFTVQASTAGLHTVTFRHSHGSGVNRPMDISVNGAVAAPGLAFPPTATWDTWADVSVTLSLTAGANTIRATATTANGGPNLDRLRVTPPSDVQPPTPPSNLRVVGAVRPYGADLAWNASTDNVGVAQYKVYNGGNVIKTAGGNITAVTVDLQPNTSYVLSVLAYDASGNPSQGSNNLTVTTPPSSDTQAPSTPANLRTTNVGGTSVSLAWNASTDNIGVTGYNVYRDGVKFATVPDLTATADALTPNTTYLFSVEAFDANNNTSARSASLSVRTATAATGGDPIFDRNVNTQLDLPWGITFLPDSTALVAERDRFEIVQVTLSGQKTVVGRITEAVTTNGEGGLMGLAVSPNFATDRYVYAMHTAASDNRVVRFTFQNGTIGAREPIVTGIAKNTFHNGGRIKFGPDGYLYIATGDGQDANRAQNLSSLNGKILRVTATGAAAPGNPFGTRVYSYGHRNPQGLAWDSQGRLWSSEFGNNVWDELNLIQSGQNYGWPTCEGSCSVSGMTNPVRQWDTASASPSGLEIVNDWVYMAAVRGGRLWVMKITGSTTDTPRAFFNGTWGRLRTVVKTPDGGLWLTSTNNDKNGGTPSVLDNTIVRLRFATS